MAANIKGGWVDDTPKNIRMGGQGMYEVCDVRRVDVGRGTYETTMTDEG